MKKRNHVRTSVGIACTYGRTVFFSNTNNSPVSRRSLSINALAHIFKGSYLYLYFSRLWSAAKKHRIEYFMTAVMMYICVETNYLPAHTVWYLKISFISYAAAIIEFALLFCDRSFAEYSIHWLFSQFLWCRKSASNSKVRNETFAMSCRTY